MTSTTKMIRKRERREIVIVVLDGVKASEDDKGVAPLRWALRVVVDPKDYLLVLTILNPTDFMASPIVGFCCLGTDHHQQQSLPCEGDECIKFLHDQINQRRKGYLEILRPYYDRCKRNGMKFQVKMAAGFQPKEIVIDEANNVKATWIIMDRCFSGDHSIRSSRDDCSIALISNKEEAEIYNHPHQCDGSKTSIVTEVEQPNPIFPKLFKGKHRSSPPSLLVNTSKEIENPLRIERTTEESQWADTTSLNYSLGQNGSNDFVRVEGRNKTSLYDIFSLGRFSEAMVLRIPIKLSWEEIMEITRGFQWRDCINQYENFEMYDGFINDPSLPVKVKRYIGDSNGIFNIEAEKRVSSTLFHRNILGLTHYHESENGIVLVYNHTIEGTLDRYLNDLRGKQVGLTFQNRMKIAIEIGRGVRYMHEECPRGPVVHGNLQPYNIFLGLNFQPLISGFERATWLQFEQEETIDTYKSKDPSNVESMELVKSDVFSFGVLLLRLFCKRPFPEDDKHLIEWARPLLLRGAFYELLDQDMEDLDMYEMYRVMCAAIECTKTKSLSRPSMTKVVSILRGENSCIMDLSSPSSDGSISGGTISIPF